MDSTEVYKCLDDIGKLGTVRTNFEKKLKKCISNSNKIILNLQNCENLSYQEFIISYSSFMADALVCLKMSSIEDERIMCAVNTIYLLHHCLVANENLNKNANVCAENEPGKDELDLESRFAQLFQTESKKEPLQANIQMISIKQLKIIELATKFVLYTSVICCLDSDSLLFMKMKKSKEKLSYGSDVLQLEQKIQHKFLIFNLKYLLPLFKNPIFGEPLRSNLIGEILVPILLMSFSPTVMKKFPEDVPHFRSELEYILENFDQSAILQEILFIRSLLHSREQSWLKRCCLSLFIRRFLFKSNGVALIIKTALSICDSQDWRKKEAIATLISSVTYSNEIEFYENIGPQVVSLVLQKDITGDLFQILGFMVFQLSKRFVKLTYQHIFQPIVKPLISITDDDVEKSSKDYGIRECVSTIYKLYVEVMLPSPDLRTFIEPVLCPLFQVSILPPTCYVKTNATLIIIRFLSQLGTSKCVESLLVLSELENSSSIPRMNPSLTLTLQSTGDEICIEAISVTSETDWIVKDDVKVKHILDILEKLKNPLVVKKFYQELLRYLDFSVLNRIKVPANLLLTVSDENNIKIANIRKLNFAVNLLGSISENPQLTEDLFHDFYSAVPFFENLLKIGKQTCEDEGLSLTKESLLLNCIMLISSYVSDRVLQKKMTHSDWKGLKYLLPSLDDLLKSSSNPALRDFIDLLKTTVQTHGVAVDPTLIKSKCNSSSQFKADQLPQSSEGSVHTYDEAIIAVCSPHLPVRGHALLTFSKLLDQKDENALKNRAKLLALFEHHLKDEDSYIYLMAIQGLVSLSNVYPDKVIPILTSEINRENISSETRLKIVEVLTQVTKRLGPLLPKHKNLFINSLLTGARNEDEYIRASCISNLGEVCKELRFSIGPIMQEVFLLIYQIIQYEKSSMVRSAGVLVVTLIFQGLGKDSLKVFESVILDIYRCLKHLIRTEKDHALVLQAGLALEEINIATKEFLLPNLKMEKKIYVTELPPKV